MAQQRWLRIIPVALLMYTFAYIDRTNVSLALDPNISTLMKDLLMNDEMKGEAMGIFFWGYLALQIPGGWLASRWSARKTVSLCLMAWGVCAVGCGLAQTYRQFETARFFLGVAESGVFPATLVLLANWFPRAERARANACWQLCQPLAVAGAAPFTGWLLKLYGWQQMLILEGLLPILWLPVWWFLIRDHPREARWISAGEKEHVEMVLKREAAELEPAQRVSWFERLLHPSLLVMIALYFLHNCAAYGCMTFFTTVLNGQGFGPVQTSLLFAVPYAITAVVMILNSWHSDRTRERRGHVAAVYLMSGTSLILSVMFSQHFWLSYALMCLAIPGPFAAMAPFWAIPSETLPRNVIGVVFGTVNAFGNLGGYAGPKVIGALSDRYHSTAIAFTVIGTGMLVCAGLAFLLPKAKDANIMAGGSSTA